MYIKRGTIFPVKKCRNFNKKSGIIFLSLFLILSVSVGGTIAYLATQTNPIVNIFKPSEVTCKVTEDFNEDGIDNIKKNVNVQIIDDDDALMDIDAYIRVKLVSYRVNQAGQTIGGETTIPEFTPGDGWKKHGEHYYYIKPVAPGGMPDTDLIGEEGILLEDYNYQFYGGELSEEEEKIPGAKPYGIKSGRAGGGYQVIEVIAEAIQAEGVDQEGTPAVTKAWGIPVDTAGNLAIN